MFINDGKSIFDNTGLIISILILIVISILSYKKCMNTNAFTTIEKFETLYAVPQNVRVLSNKSDIIIRFNINNDTNYIKPSKFLVVLGSYDKNKVNTGNNIFYLSDENPNASANLKITSICTMVNGVPECQYKFSNVPIRDSQGNPYLYKVGVAAIFDNFVSPIMQPENINDASGYFTISTSIENQNAEYKEFQEYKKQKLNTADVYDNTIATADGQYELIKRQLGNYPDELLINEQMVKAGTLSDIVDKSMALGKINVNVTTSE